jgi:hypothetical protein
MEYHFGSGPAYTVFGYDKVQMGSYTVPDMPIWEIVDHNIPVLDVSRLDAIVGIGPGTEDRKHPSLMDKFGITRYSVCFQQQDQSPGWMIWQDDDPVGKPGFTEIQVQGNVHWGVSMTDVRVGQNVFACQSGCGAVLDSGTSLIAAPKNAMAQLAASLNHLNPDCSNMDDMPYLRFEVAGKTLELPPQAYIARMVGVIPPSIWDVLTFKPEAQVVMQCVPLLMDLDAMQTPLGPLWIIGMPFFRYYYTTFSFDTRQVHVARALPNCEPATTAPVVLVHQKPAVRSVPMTINPATLTAPRTFPSTF